MLDVEPRKFVLSQTPERVPLLFAFRAAKRLAQDAERQFNRHRMNRFLWALVLVAIALTAYLGLWPVPIRAVAWQAPAAPGDAGAHAANDRLAKLNRIPLGAEAGPEHIVLARDGKLYAAVAGGRILRMNPDGSAQEVFAETGARVLGFDFDAAGNLIAADAIRGLLSVSPDRKVEVLADHVSGDPIRYADAVIVASNGKVVFSDASGRFAPSQWGSTFEAAVLDILEQSSTGRILEYDPATKTTRVVARGLSFANGVALSRDERSLFVAETGRYRIWKIDVAADDLDVGKASPQATVMFDNLPGYPDNLMRGLDGRIWVGFTGPRSAAVDAMAGRPFLRELTLRLPRRLWPLPQPYGHVFAFTEDGKVVADLQDPTGAYPETTGLTETADRLYVQNLHQHAIGWLAR
jgi:sugar lactone lactonase YvrE